MRKEWQLHALGDVCKMGSGGTPLTSKREYYNGGTIPWLQSGEVAQGEIRIATNFITQAGFENSAARIFPPDTVLVAMYGATAGQVGILRFEASTNQAICGIFPNERFHPKFLYYALLSKKNELVSRAVGNAQPNISQVKIKNTYVPVPPLAEQKRIVAILDKAFEGIEAAVANAEKNLTSARELFDSYVNVILSASEEQSERRRLGSLVSRLTNGFVGPIRDIYVDSGVPYLLARHVKSNRLSFDGKTFISKEFNLKNKKSMLLSGDVLLVQSGHIGHSAVVTDEHAGHNCHAMIVITPIQERIGGEYMSLVFNSPLGRQQFKKIRSGSTVPHLTCREVKELVIAVPSLDAQGRIVKQSSEMKSNCARLEEIYRDKTSYMNCLKQILLQQAFAGDLTVRSAEAVQEAAE